MKKIIVSLLSLFMLVGCGSMLQIAPVTSQPCDVYEQVGATSENSIIAAKIANPCVAQKAFVTAAQLPMIWAGEKYLSEFDAWYVRIRSTVEAGLSMSDLQSAIILKVAEFNKQAGMTLLILSNNFLVFENDIQLQGSVDKTLTLMSLDDLYNSVHKLSLIGLKQMNKI